MFCFRLLCTCHHLEPCPSRKDLRLPSPASQTRWEEYAGPSTEPYTMQLGKPRVPLKVLANRKCKGFGVERGFFQEKRPQPVSSHLLKWAFSHPPTPTPHGDSDRQPTGGSVQGTWKQHIFLQGQTVFRVWDSSYITTVWLGHEIEQRSPNDAVIHMTSVCTI